ncbi:disease resistance protein RGA5-like [Oryza brachyantha]|uniref:NB-ARC domain-containing protein n=1 Tax=Oryza brachyantha TaxID=4533 RepID=J3KZ89_ORYBR|nr:disease resistance protein RGA5-like [Oryza brachyantha]
MAAIAVSASVGVMKFLLPKLIALLCEEYKLQKSAKDDIKYLHDEMSSMDTLLIMLANKEVLDAEEKAWRNKVQELAYDMEDCMDQIMLKWPKIKRRDIAKRIKELKVHVQDAMERRDRYKLSELVTNKVVSTDDVASNPQQLAPNDEEDSLVGILRPKQKITSLLMDKEQKLKVVSIVGCAGVGKTTLANQVYLGIKGVFSCSAFVSLPQNPSMNKVFQYILSEVGFKTQESLDDEYALITEIKRCLQEQRYLIVIDNIWSEAAWNRISCAFPNGNNGSRIMITTCIEDLGRVCCQNLYGQIYKVEPLNDLDSRLLFFRRAFNNDGTCPEHFKKVSEEILKKCVGVPLAIISIANLLASQDPQGNMMIETWERTLSSLGYELETTPNLQWMRHVLSLSYNNLGPDLKTCVLYLCTFPEYSSIHKDDLIRQWIAGGLVTEKFGCAPYEIAERYFNNLINRSLIHPDDIDDCGMVISCRVHDLMLDLIISKSMEENFIAILDDQNTMRGSCDARRFTIHFNEHSKNTEKNLELMRSVSFKARSISFWGPIQCMLDISKFEYLRILQLEDKYSNTRTDSYNLTHICGFSQLRYLKMRGIPCKLPQKIGGLKYLETLDMDENARNFPSDVCKLKLMSHLAFKHAKIPNGIDKMVALRTLKVSNNYDTPIELYEALGSLRNLRELEFAVTFHLSRDEVVSLISSLKKLERYSLQSLILSNNGYSHDVGYLLSHWYPPPDHLRRLHFHVFEVFSCVPDWIAPLNKLRSLIMCVHELSRDGFDILARLPCLLLLKLSVQVVKEKDALVCSGTFQNLEEFWFRHKVPCLTFESHSMPKLRVMDIQFDEDCLHGVDDKILDGIDHLTSLMRFSAHISRPLPMSRRSFSGRISQVALLSPCDVEEESRNSEEDVEEEQGQSDEESRSSEGDVEKGQGQADEESRSVENEYVSGGDVQEGQGQIDKESQSVENEFHCTKRHVNERQEQIEEEDGEAPGMDNGCVQNYSFWEFLQRSPKKLKVWNSDDDYVTQGHAEVGQGQTDEEARGHRESAEAKLRRAISKHPGIPSINIDHVDWQRKFGFYI